MAKSLGERCMSGIKGLEDQISESTTVEALNIYMNSNIFMWSKVPNNIDDLILMETLMSYLNSAKDEHIKKNLFNVLFLELKDNRKVDFLVRLASLALTTLSSPTLDIFAFWIKNSAPKPLFLMLVKRLLTDILSVDASRRNILQRLPQESISFTAIFLIGLTEAYQYLNPGSDRPCLTVLRAVIDWVKQHKQQLFNPDSLQVVQSSNIDGDDSRNTSFPGLLLWTLSHPLYTMNEKKNGIIDNNPEKTKEEAQLISVLHFELISYLDERIRGSSTYLLSKKTVKFIVDMIKRYAIPETPQSPETREDRKKVNLFNSDPSLTICLLRLVEIVQIGLRNDSFQCSKSELSLLLKDISGNKYIDDVINDKDY